MNDTTSGQNPEKDVAVLLNNELHGIKIPTRPAVLSSIEAQMRSRSPNLGALEKVISLDVSISGSLLKIANSAFFGHAGQVRSVKKALQILGLNTVGTAIAALSLRKAFAHVPNLERFWDSSAQIAQLSGWLATRVDTKLSKLRPEEAYTFGLFRDCGIPILMSFYSTYFDVLKLANNEAARPFTEVERDDIGVDHGAIGAMLAKEWQLPLEYQAAIELHHDVTAIREQNSPAVPELARHFMAIAQLAEYLFQRLTGLNRTCEWGKLGEACLGVLGLDEEGMNQLLQMAEEQGLCKAPGI